MERKLGSESERCEKLENDANSGLVQAKPKRTCMYMFKAELDRFWINQGVNVNGDRQECGIKAAIRSVVVEQAWWPTPAPNSYGYESLESYTNSGHHFLQTPCKLDYATSFHSSPMFLNAW